MPQIEADDFLFASFAASRRPMAHNLLFVFFVCTTAAFFATCVSALAGGYFG